MTPVIAPLASNVPIAPTSSFRERLLEGNVSNGATTPTLHQDFTTEGDFIVIRIPKHYMFADLRTKDASVDETGKKTNESATLVISATADKKADLAMSFMHRDKGRVLVMDAKKSINLNIGLNFRDLKVMALSDWEKANPGKALPAAIPATK